MFDAQFQENTKRLGEFKEVEGVEIGRQQVIAMAAQLTTVTGENIISVNDVSSIPHDVKITVSNDSPITVCGNNLAFRETIIASGAVEVSEDEYYIEKPNLTYKKTVFKNTYGYEGVIYAGANFKYPTENVGALLNVLYTDGTSRGMLLSAVADGQYHYNYTYSMPDKVVDSIIWSYNVSAPAYIKDIQVGFFENKALEKPFNTEYTPSNGEVILKAESPNMTVLANAHISMDYLQSLDAQAQKIEFMRDYQNGGERLNYDFAFAGRGWTLKNFLPVYDMYIDSGYMMFSRSEMFDIATPFEKAGVSIRRVGNGQYLFFNCPNLTKIPTVCLDGSISSSSAYGTFQSCPKLQSIHLILVNQKPKSDYWTTAFNNDTSLKNVTIEGKIASTIDFKACPLTLESAKNIILALENYRGTTYEEQFACYFSSAVWTLLDAEGAAHEGLTWREYLNAIAWNY